VQEKYKEEEMEVSIGKGEKRIVATSPTPISSTPSLKGSIIGMASSIACVITSSKSVKTSTGLILNPSSPLQVQQFTSRQHRIFH